jgi:hypothetical protein
MKLFFNGLFALGLAVLVIVVLGIDASHASTMSTILAVPSAFIVSWYFEIAFEKWPWLKIESDEQREAKQRAAKTYELGRAVARASRSLTDSNSYRAGQMARRLWLWTSGQELRSKVEN